MDGPSTMLALYRKLIADRFSNELNDLIDLGSCSLHVVHGALGTGVVASGWKVKDTMKSASYMFRDSPARREDYLTWTDSTDLPLPFCGTRWVEDKRVAQRLIAIWPGYSKVIKKYQKLVPSKQPKCKSFAKAVTSIENPLTVAELKFFSYVCDILMPYLTMHQTDAPMIPFMYSDLKKLCLNLLKGFVKPAIWITLNLN